MIGLKRFVRDDLTLRTYALRYKWLVEELVAQRNDRREISDSGLRATGAVPERIRVFVFLGHDFGTGWSHDELPGINEQLPYGYYHAEDNGCTVRYSVDAKESRVTRFLRLGVRRLVGFDLLHAWRNRDALFDTDVVWTHTELEHLAVLALWRLVPCQRRPKLIAQCIWLFDKWDRLSVNKRRIYIRLLSQADVLTVQSSEGMKVARRALPAVRCRINPYGTHMEAMVPAFFRPAHKPFRILSLGRDMHRDWATMVAAVGGWEACEARIGARYLNRRLVRHATNVELVKPDSAQLQSLYDWADVVVVALKPNVHVSGITVITEAVLMGVPVVCTDTGGLRSYFSDDEIMYVPPNDAGAMRRAIAHLAANDTLRFAMAQTAQARLLRADLSTRARARRMAELSRELLAEGSDAEA